MFKVTSITISSSKTDLSDDLLFDFCKLFLSA